jgi:hypothetical protein
VPEGEQADCTEQAGSRHAIEPSADDEAADAKGDSPHAVMAADAESDRQRAAAGVKSAKRAKSKTARSHRLAPFLRKVDTFLSQRR